MEASAVVVRRLWSNNRMHAPCVQVGIVHRVCMMTHIHMSVSRPNFHLSLLRRGTLVSEFVVPITISPFSGMRDEPNSISRRRSHFDN